LSHDENLRVGGLTSVDRVHGSKPYFRPRRKPLHGFTLIELLVVVSIITLLIAILLPSLNRARTAARSVACASNMRQYNTALITYGLDNNNDPFPYVGGELFMKPLEKYHGLIESVRFCPEAAEVSPNGGTGTAHFAWSYGGYHGSYALNGFLYNSQGGNSGNGGGHNYAAATTYPRGWWDTLAPKHASEVPTFVDSMWVDLWPHHNDTIPTDLENPVPVPLQQNPWHLGRACIDRHLLAVNLAYTDGHVELTDLADLWNVQWSRTFELQGRVTVPAVP